MTSFVAILKLSLGVAMVCLMLTIWAMATNLLTKPDHGRLTRYIVLAITVVGALVTPPDPTKMIVFMAIVSFAWLIAPRLV
jgi:Sec-independent protein secretion pathway component TatC